MDWNDLVTSMCTSIANKTQLEKDTDISIVKHTNKSNKKKHIHKWIKAIHWDFSMIGLLLENK